MSVSGIIISTGPKEAQLIEASAPALAQQVDELVVIANGLDSAAALPDGVRVVQNARMLGFSANINKGVAATSGDYVVVSNPDAIPEPGAIDALVAFADEHPRCGVAGPKMVNPDGTLQASRRRFPTVAGTIVRRTPLRLLFPPQKWQRGHYMLDAPTNAPLQVDTMLGAFLLMRRTMLEELGGWDDGYQLYVEDIDLNYRAMRAGWERWWVPDAVVRHEYQAVIDKRFLTRRNWWHTKAMLRFLRKHPERLLALR
ncbi:MAG TPA: glycosyltransferase family 2 protein [Gaiellaceae bacterium]|nr:glycosyltransferase family 2 protein [Gaiellaceae bacterium]